MSVVRFLRTRDPGLTALRRATRAGILVPGLFAIGVEVLGNATIGLFAAFGSIGMLLFVDFGGPMRDRLTAQALLVVTGAALVSLGTLASRAVGLAAAGMAVVAFCVLFSGVVSSVLASASTALLLSFVVPATLRAPASAVPDRLVGWGLAGAASMIAVGLLWPAPAREPLRSSTAGACAALARRLRAEVDCVRGGFVSADRDALDRVAPEATHAVAALRTSFFATPYRPTGLSTAARTLVRLVDQILWLDAALSRIPLSEEAGPADAAVCEVKLAAAELLDEGAVRLRTADGVSAPLRAAARRLVDARAAMERTVTSSLPAGDPHHAAPEERMSMLTGFVRSLGPSFRAQEMSFAVSAIAANIDLTLAARRRTWCQRLLGRRPEGAGSPLASAHERAGAHVERHSVWLHNSIRGAIALGLAVLVAELTGVQHSFWVVFGTMAVLRSNALLTGENSLRAIAGTAAGIVIGGGLIFAIGSNTTVFWVLLPVAVLFTGLAPAASSFAAGQAGFTAALLILFNIIQPEGWSIGLVRIEDVAIGCAVSVLVGLLFWPRGAASELGEALAEAYTESARYLRTAADHGMTRSAAPAPEAAAPRGGAYGEEAYDSAAAARRLDDAFREFLAERGTKSVPLSGISTLVSAATVLRVTADAVLDLWERDEGRPTGGRAAAIAEIHRAADAQVEWYESAARALAGHGEVPEPAPHDAEADSRLIQAVEHDLGGPDRRWSATAIKIVWTADHIRVAQRLQTQVHDPARAVAARR